MIRRRKDEVDEMEGQINRTDELKRMGARQLGSNTHAPFVKWGDAGIWVEGIAERIWEGKYGRVLRLKVTAVCDGLQASTGGGEERSQVLVQPGHAVNIDLSSAGLKTTVTDELVSSEIHIAFIGWNKAKSGYRCRDFEVLQMGYGAIEFEDQSDGLPF